MLEFDSIARRVKQTERDYRSIRDKYPAPFENLSALTRGGGVFIRRRDKIGLDPEKT